MDARIDTHRAFGISLGDAHVIRNAGGSAQEALRSLILSQQLLGTKEVLVIKHTDCGMLYFTEDGVHEAGKKNLGDKAADEIKGLEFKVLPNLEQGVKDDIAFLQKSAAIPESVKLSGWVYDVKTGKTTQVV